MCILEWIAAGNIQNTKILFGICIDCLSASDIINECFNIFRVQYNYPHLRYFFPSSHQIKELSTK